MAESGAMRAQSEFGMRRFREASLAYIVADDEGRCLDASDEACRVLGVGREEVLGTALEELLSADARERFGHVWRAFRSGGGHAGPFRIDATRSIEIDVTADILPSRHLVLLSPIAATSPDGARSLPIDHTHAQAHGRSHRGQPSPTAREREILRMLAAGATDGQIAQRLSLSPATVRTHVRNAKAKLGATTRAQAVALALERRIIE